MPIENTEWSLAIDTGWTLDYIKSLPMQDYFNYLQIKDAKAKAARR